MKLKITEGFREKLNAQVDYIAQDKPGAARKFKKDILSSLEGITDMPYKHRKSIFFDREDIRDLIFKGYVVIYRIHTEKDQIEIFGFVKHKNNPF